VKGQRWDEGADDVITKSRLRAFQSILSVRMGAMSTHGSRAPEPWRFHCAAQPPPPPPTILVQTDRPVSPVPMQVDRPASPA
jgi:hypothetical protein